MMKQTTLKTKNMNKNSNISFPVGTALAVQKYAKKLGFSDILSKFKQKGISLANLANALISYKLTENLSLTRGSDWINRTEVLETFNLKAFEQKTLHRAIETIGEKYQEVILDSINPSFAYFGLSS